MNISKLVSSLQTSLSLCKQENTKIIVMKVLMIMYSLSLCTAQSSIIQDILYINPSSHSVLFRNCVLDYLCAVGNKAYLQQKASAINWLEKFTEEQLYLVRKMLELRDTSLFGIMIEEWKKLQGKYEGVLPNIFLLLSIFLDFLQANQTDATFFNYKINMLNFMHFLI